MTTPTITTFSPVNSALNPGQPIPIWNGGSGVEPFIANNDTAQTMYVGAKSDVIRQDTSSCLPFYPLGGMAMPDVDMWAFIPESYTAPVNYLVIPGATSWTPSPVQVQLALNAAGLMKDTTGQAINGNVQGTTAAVNAPTYGPITLTNPGLISRDTSVNGLLTGIPNNISTTGVPLLQGSTLIKNQSVISQGIGTSNNSATFTMTQIGYVFALTIFATGNFSSFFHLTFTWSDSVSGIQTGQEDYWFVPGSGSGANAHVIIGVGKVKGNNLVITSANPSTSSVAVSHSYVLLNTSTVFSTDSWETIQFNTAGFTATASDETAGIIGASSFSVPATITGSRMLPFFNGKITFTASTSSGATDLMIQIVALADQSLTPGGSAAVIWQSQTNSNGFLQQTEVALPAVQCQVLLINQHAGAETCAFTATISKQR